MKYNVHLYAVVRVKVVDVEALSQTEAIEKAAASVDLNHILNDYNYLPPNVEHVEYADEVTGALVDEVGDEDYERSTFYEDGPDGWKEKRG